MEYSLEFPKGLEEIIPYCGNIWKTGRCLYNAAIQNVLSDANDQTIEDFDLVVNVNLCRVWSCMKYELQQMWKQGFGAIRITAIYQEGNLFSNLGSAGIDSCSTNKNFLNMRCVIDMSLMLQQFNFYRVSNKKI